MFGKSTSCNKKTGAGGDINTGVRNEQHTGQSGMERTNAPIRFPYTFGSVEPASGADAPMVRYPSAFARMEQPERNDAPLVRSSGTFASVEQTERNDGPMMRLPGTGVSVEQTGSDIQGLKTRIIYLL